MKQNYTIYTGHANIYSPIRLKHARLVKGLLYGTWVVLVY